MKKKEIEYGVLRDAGDGIQEIFLPYNTPFKSPVKRKYGVSWQTYPVEDNDYGSNCYVIEQYDTEAKVKYKKLLVNVPPEILAVLSDSDRKETLDQRHQEEHTDFRPTQCYTDGNGDWHNGTLEDIAYERYKRASEEDELDVFDEAVLRGPLSDNPKIRNAQVRKMVEIVQKAIAHLPPTLRQTFDVLFCQCRLAVDVAEEEGVGKSAISNRKNRLIQKMSDIFTALGYVVPTKAELKAEKKAVLEREERLEQAMVKQREEERDKQLVREMITLFYNEGFTDRTTLERIERELDEAA